jgi:hypothetical protein
MRSKIQIQTDPRYRIQTKYSRPKIQDTGRVLQTQDTGYRQSTPDPRYRYRQSTPDPRYRIQIQTQLYQDNADARLCVDSSSLGTVLLWMMSNLDRSW